MSARVVCFGELLLRLGAPGRERLLQTPRFEVHVGGAEANVAVSLARFGDDAAMLSAVPDNALGDAAIGELRRHGVDTRAVTMRSGRMGLYFHASGALHRPSEVLYDRAGSAFANAGIEAFDWQAAFDGATWLHASGVTPALGARNAAVCLHAMRAARAAGLRVAFDGNHRASLWRAWNGDAATITRGLLAEANVAFADHRDIAVALGVEPFTGDPADAIAQAAAAAFDAFASLSTIATTIRHAHSVDRHALSGILLTRAGGVHVTPTYMLAPIVDRIGGGDAFAVAAACLKHSIPGDANLVSVDDVQALLDGEGFGVRR